MQQSSDQLRSSCSINFSGQEATGLRLEFLIVASTLLVLLIVMLLIVESRMNKQLKALWDEMH